MGSCKNSKMKNIKKKVYLLRFNAAAPIPMHIYIRVKQLSKHLINMSCDGLVCSAIFSHKKHFFNVGNKKTLGAKSGLWGGRDNICSSSNSFSSFVSGCFLWVLAIQLSESSRQTNFAILFTSNYSTLF